MNRKFLLALWGGLFVVCGAFGFVQEPVGAMSFLMAALSLVFFAPPALLLRQAGKQGHIPTAVLVRNLSALSLGLTLAGLVANVLSLLGSEALGNVLHVVLVIVSVPMFCAQIWVSPLFCWAFLMIGAHKLQKKMKKTQT